MKIKDWQNHFENVFIRENSTQIRRKKVHEIFLEREAYVACMQFIKNPETKRTREPFRDTKKD